MKHLGELRNGTGTAGTVVLNQASSSDSPSKRTSLRHCNFSLFMANYAKWNWAVCKGKTVQNTTGKQGKRKSMAQLKPLQLTRSRRVGNPRRWVKKTPPHPHWPGQFVCPQTCLHGPGGLRGWGGKRAATQWIFKQDPETRTSKLDVGDNDDELATPAALHCHDNESN